MSGGPAKSKEQGARSKEQRAKSRGKSEVRSQKSNKSAFPDTPAGSANASPARTWRPGGKTYQTRVRNPAKNRPIFEAVKTTGLLLARVDEAPPRHRRPEARPRIHVE